MAPSVLLFLFLYLLSFLFVLGTEDWMSIWVGLEINMMSFILLVYKQMELNNSESCMKYFFIQSVGSALLLNLFYLNKYYFSYFGSLVMSYKMGSGIFFFWFPSMCLGIGWISCFMLMTFQKLIPLMLMSMMISWMLWMMLMFSLFVGAWGSFNQVSLKKLMAFSSIHHIGWLMMSIMMEDKSWIFYLFMYMFIIFPMIMLFCLEGSSNISDVTFWKYKIWLIVGLLSMAGMPPLLGFFLKWFVLFYVMSIHYLMLVFMIIMSIIMFYIYVRISYSLMLGGGYKFSWEAMTLKYKYRMDLLNLMGVGFSFFMLLL